MTLLTRLERKIGWLAIDHLPVFIVVAQSLLYVYGRLNPGATEFLLLSPEAVRAQQEYWRLLTFIFVTPTQNPLFAFFYLYLFYSFGTALENEWGSFPFTLFYLCGILGSIAGTFVAGFTVGSFFLNTSVFLAFAALYPDYQILLFFILPVKMKWLGWLTWAWVAVRFVQSYSGARVFILFSLANYFLFFTRRHVASLRAAAERIRHRRRFKDWSS